MARKPAHHPPAPGRFDLPESETPGFIPGDEAVAGFGCRTLCVAVIPRAAAVEVVLREHYSHRIVNNSYVHLGVFLQGEMLGVLQFGYMLNPACAGKVVAGTRTTEYLELNRMWLDDRAPRNSESRALSCALKYIRRVMPQVAWVQSFADERCGGWGVVYQAANFEYLGHHWTSFYELDGETYHEMLLTAHAKGGNRGAYLRANLARAVHRKLLQFPVHLLDPAVMAAAASVVRVTVPKARPPVARSAEVAGCQNARELVPKRARAYTVPAATLAAHPTAPRKRKRPSVRRAA